MSSKRERLEASIKGELADRAPVALWRHFPVDDQEPGRLADSVANFQERFDFDFVKVTPASSYCIKDYGVEDQWQGASEGTRAYTKRVITEPAGWSRLPVLDPQRGHLAAQLQSLTSLRQRLGPEVPIIQTIFSPLAQAKNLAGETRLMEHIHQEPEQVKIGLKTLVESTVAFVLALGSLEIDGIFFASQHASFQYFDPEGYQMFGETYDLPILEAASGWWLNVLHLHGEAIMFDLASRYPVQVVNWHDLETYPSLKEGAGQFAGAVCGGVRRETLALGTAADVRGECDSALEHTRARGMILSTGCVVPILAPEGNLRVVRDSVDFA